MTQRWFLLNALGRFTRAVEQLSTHVQTMQAPLPQPELVLEWSGAVGEVASLRTSQSQSQVQSLSNILDGILLMGVPKSKVSPSRKRMKHLQHVPEPVSWYKCLRCGEPKRPHRICTAHMEICALSDEDYETHKQKSGRSSSSSSDSA